MFTMRNRHFFKRWVTAVPILLFALFNFKTDQRQLSMLNDEYMQRTSDRDQVRVSLPKVLAKAQSSTSNQDHFFPRDRQRGRNTLLPPFESLVDTTTVPGKIIGDVNSLLDFAIVGFGKCGTTTLLQWLGSSSEIHLLPGETTFFRDNRPDRMVHKLYELHNLHQTEQQETTDFEGKQSQEPPIIYGYKNPFDIERDEVRSLFRNHWPSTKIILSIRHPFYWFESYYNYLQNEAGRSKTHWTVEQMLKKRKKFQRTIYTGKGEFHNYMALLGKTNLTDAREWSYLEGFVSEADRIQLVGGKLESLPNQIFLLEISQLADSNITRRDILKRDLETFLGLEHRLPEILHIRPGKPRKSFHDGMKIDMCSDKNEPIRREMMHIARNAAPWIKHYFLKSPDVFVSSRPFLEASLSSWMVDPCEETKPLRV